MGCSGSTSRNEVLEVNPPSTKGVVQHREVVPTPYRDHIHSPQRDQCSQSPPQRTAPPQQWGEPSPQQYQPAQPEPQPEAYAPPQPPPEPVQQTPPRQPSSEPVLAPQDVQLHVEEQPGPAEPAEPAEPAHAKSAAKRREGVSAQATSQTTGTKKPRALHVKTDAERKIIRGATAGNMLFAGIEEKQMDTIIDAMFEMECKQGEVVILQGDVGDNFYVVKSGQYQVYLKIKGDEPVHTYVEKDGRAPAFGELALMYNCPRAATIKCSVPGTLWGLDQETFRDIMMTANKEKHESNAQFLKSVSILQQLTDEQRDALCSTLQEVHFKDGETVVKQGDPADALYFIRKGDVAVMIKTDWSAEGLGKKVGAMRAGEFFGENAVSGEAQPTRAASIVAEGPVEGLKLTAENFASTIGDLSETLKYNFNQKVLGGMEMFKCLSESERQILIDALQEVRFSEGDKIITEGEEGRAFYIIKSGTVCVTKGAEVLKDKMGTGAYFGEMAILNNAPRMATVSATSDAILMELDRDTFNSLLGPMNEILSRVAAQREKEAADKKKAEVEFSELKLMTILGVGTFGRVKLVVHTETGIPYALKCMRKGQIVALKQVEHVMNEKKILAMCDHPFLLVLAGAYQDSEELYMLLELALGGELFSILRDKVKFDEPTSRFYSGTVQAAFEYLHDRKIVYRDLKPENLLLDSVGYLKVVDFGFAKIISDRTWTLCGTPEYLAPEIISNKGHNLAVDWWSLGILIFELLNGVPPFAADDPMDIYQQILRGKISWPSTISKTGRECIAKLLVANPAARLGNLKRGSREVREQNFFKSLNFSELEKKTIPAPHIPDIKSPTDTSNFEEYEDEDGAEWARFNDPSAKYFDEF